MHPVTHPITRLFPSFGGWDTFRRATINLLIVALAISAGTWITHQIEYLIVYGGRFDAVMASTPHRLYMAPTGALLLLLGLSGLLALLSMLVRARITRNLLTEHLPARVVGVLDAPALSLTARPIARTAVALAVCQVVIYTIQENLEAASMTGSWPGFGVLVGVHAAVLPLHILVAACLAVLLWAISLGITRSERSVRLARALARIFARRRDGSLRTYIPRSNVPARRILPGSPGLRAPPAVS